MYANLNVYGNDPFTGKRATGTIRMRKVGNGWLVEKQTWEEFNEESQ
jgi:hypothetical protein